MINFKKFAKKNAKKIKYGVFSFSVLLFGSLATASVFFNNKKKLKKNDDRSSKNKVDLNAKSKLKYGDLKNEVIQVDYNGSDYTFQINGKTVITGLADLNTELNNQSDTTEDDYTIDTLTLTFDETKTVAKAKSKATSFDIYGDLTNQAISVSYNVTDGKIKYTVNEQEINFDQLQTELDNQGITLTKDKNTETTLDATALKNLDVSELTKAKKIKNSIATYGDLLNETIKVDYNGTDYTFQVGTNSLIVGLTDLNTELNNQGDAEENYTIDDFSSTLTIDTTKTLAKAKTKTTLITNINSLLSVELKKAIAQAKKDSITFTSGILTQASFKEDGSFVDNLLNNKTVEQLKGIKTGLEGLTNKISEATTTKKTALKTDINNLLSVELKKAISQAKTDSIDFTNGTLSQANFKEDGSFVDNLLNNKKVSQLTTIKTNLQGLAAKITKAINNKKITLKININVLLSPLKAAIKQVKTDSIDFTSGTLTQASFKDDGSFVDNLLNNKNFSQLTTIKTNLTGLANKISEATTTKKTSLKEKINNSLSVELKKAIEQAKADSIAFTSGTLTQASFKDDGSFVDNLLNNKKVSQLTKIKDTLGTLTNKISEATTTKKTSLKEKINNSLSVELKKAIEQAKADSIAFTSGTLTQASFKDDGSFVENLLNNKKVSQLTIIKNDLEGLSNKIAKANSIKTFGNLTSLTDEMLGVSYVGTNLVFQIDTKDSITGIKAFKTQYDLQSGTENKLTTIDQIEAIIGKASFKVTELTKAKSITRYGDLTNLTNETLGVSYDGTNFVFQLDGKDPITGIATFKTQYNLQNEKTNDWTTIDQVETIIKTVNFKDGELTKAKIKESKSIFGDLTSLGEGTLGVSYDGTNFVFHLDGKDPITGIEAFKTQYSLQSDQTNDSKTINQVKTIITSAIFKDDQFEKAKAKKTSIDQYGNLTNLDNIVVDYDETNYTFQVGTNSLITSLVTFKTELEKQEITISTINNIDDVTSIITGLKGTLNTTIAKAKAKKTSIDTYGNLAIQTINVSYDYFEDEEIQYVIKYLKYPFWESINFYDLKAEATKQGMTLTNESELKDNSILGGLVTSELTNAKKKYQKNQDSIATYGDLTSSDNTISVFHNVTDGKIKYTVNNHVINFEKLSTEATNQGIILTSEAELTDNSDLGGLVTSELTTAKSIDTYGDLTNLDNIKVDYNRTNYTFQVGTNSLIVGLTNLKAQLENQGITTTTIDDIDDVVEAIDGLTGTLNTTNADSITTYGDLTNLDNVVVDYNGANYTFQVGSNESITSLELFKKELENQEIITSTISDIDDVTSIITGLTGTLDTANAKSIENFGNLTNLTDGTLGVSYDGTNFVFHLDGKDPITGIATFKTQYNLQNGETNDWITFDQIKTKIGVINFKATELVTAESKKKHGDLTNLNEGTLGVSYDGTNFVFQIDTKDPITGIATFKTQYNLQSGETNDWITFDQIKTKIGVINFKATELLTAESKKTHGDLTNINEGTLGVSYDGTDFVFQIDKKNLITGISNFKEQYNLQSGTENELTTIDQIEAIIGKASFKADELIKAKSIATYGDLTSQVINVSFDGTIKYTANNQTPIDFDQLKAEALKQEITSLTTEEALTDNSVLNGLVTSELTKAKTKKVNFEKAKVYFDLTDVENASFFNKANEETINAITTEINKINDYDALSQEVKDIVNHNDNSDLKNALDTRLQELDTKKTNLEKAKVYFDLTNIQDPSFFNKTDEETINAITTEINKINDYDTLIQEVKGIVDHNDNVEFKNALETLLQQLQTKKANLEAAQNYFDLSDVKDASFFNKTDEETYSNITDEINKINVYFRLLPEVKEIVNHNDNVDLKNALDTRLQELQTKKINLEKANDYFDLHIKDSSKFNNETEKVIELIKEEINKDNFISLSDDVKLIINHNDNSGFKIALTNKFNSLKNKKLLLEKTKTAAKAKSIATYGNLKNELFVSFEDQEFKFNTSNKPDAKLSISELDTQYFLQYDLDLELESLVDVKEEEEWGTLIINEDSFLKSLAKVYFVSNDVQTFFKVNDQSIEKITKEINKINNFNILSEEMKEIVNRINSYDSKNSLNVILQKLKANKINLELAQSYFDLNIKDPSLFNRATKKGIELITKEIEKNTFATFSQEVQEIINHNDNFDLKNALDTKFQTLQTKKTNLETAKVYFDPTNVKNASFFNKTNEETINAITTEINKINNYDNFSNNVKTIINHNDNSDLKNALDTKLQSLQTKKANLEKAKAYFDLTNVGNESFFNKADDKTINVITTEINKINNYDNFSDNVKKIINHNDNSELKNALDTKLQSLQTKKANFESAQNYFDLTDVKDPSFFNKTNDQTINQITTEINKINVYFRLLPEVKEIVNHNDNSDLKNALDTRLQSLQIKKANLEKAKAYFDVKDASFFNKTNHKTINEITTQINKINDYDSLDQEVKEIVNHNDNVEFKNALDTKLQSLKIKKINLEKAKAYFDLIDVENASFFNKANDETINEITTEINKINNYDSLDQEVKEIVNHNDNSDLKNALDTRLQSLQTKKANLVKAKTYFDLTNVENASIFNKANKETINEITTEINKINNYDHLANDVKKIVEYSDNAEFKNALETILQSLQTKKANLVKAKDYFDLTNVKNASFFNKTNDQTINAISKEINKINVYFRLLPEVKEIVNHNDNVDLKKALDTRIQELQTKKTNLELAQSYFVLHIKDPSIFNNATEEVIELIDEEINKDNFISLSDDVKKIINHIDNSEFKIALTNKFNSLKNKKLLLEKTRAAAKAKSIATFGNLKNELFASFEDQKFKFNTSDKPDAKLSIPELNTQYFLQYDSNLELKSIKDVKEEEQWGTLIINEDSFLKSLTKAYFASDNVQTFFKANDQTIEKITTEINKINNFNILSEEMKEFVARFNSYKSKNYLYKKLKENKANLEKAKAYLDLNIKDPSIFNNATEKGIELITKEIDKDIFATLSQGVQEIVNHNDNLTKKNALINKFNLLKTKKANLEKVKAYLDLSNVKKPLFFNKVDQTKIRAIDQEKFKISQQNNFSKEEKKIINHPDNLYLKVALFRRLKELQIKKANLEKAKAYFDLIIKDPSTFNNATEKEIELITKEINKDTFAILPQKVQEIINHNDNLTKKNTLNNKFNALKIKKANLEKAKNYFNLNIKDPSLFNRATKKGIELITKEIDRNYFMPLYQEAKEIIHHPVNWTKKLALNKKIRKLRKKRANLEEARTYFNYFEPKLVFYDSNFGFLAREVKEKLLKTKLSQEVQEIVNHNDNSDLKKKWLIGLENLKLDWSNWTILNIFKRKNVLIRFRARPFEILQIFLDPYKAFNEDIEAIIKRQNNLPLKKFLQKEFSAYKISQKKSLKTISILENGDLSKNTLFVDYIDHQFVFKKNDNIDSNFEIFGIKPLVKILILQSIVNPSFYPFSLEQFEEKLINISESNKQIFFKNWEQARQKWILDLRKKNFIQSNNHLLNWHSQNNLFLHPSFILAFFVIIFGVDRFVKWIKRLWKN